MCVSEVSSSLREENNEEERAAAKGANRFPFLFLNRDNSTEQPQLPHSSHKHSHRLLHTSFLKAKERSVSVYVLLSSRFALLRHGLSFSHVYERERERVCVCMCGSLEETSVVTCGRRRRLG